MRNGVFGVLSTGLSGLTNVVVQLVAAAVLSASDFGEFSIAATTVILVVGLARAVVGQTDMIRGPSGRDPRPVAAAYLLALLVVLGGILALLISTSLGGSVLWLIGLGVSASSVFVLQDCIRYRSFRERRAGVALLSDGVATGALIILVPVMLTLQPSPAAALAAWTVATGIGAIAGAIPLRYAPRGPRSGGGWVFENRDLVAPAVGEYAIQSALPYALNFVILGLGGLDALAGYRLAQLLFAVIANLATGLNNVTLPYVVEHRSPRTARRVAHAESLVIVLLGGIVLAALFAVPTQLGVDLFSAAWTSMLAFAWPAAVHGVVNALAVPVFSLLRLIGLARYSFFVRIASAVATLLAAIIASTAGPVAVAWALALPATAAYLARWVGAELRVAALVREGGTIPLISRT